MKKVTVVYFDAHLKTTKILRKKLLDLRSCLSFQEGGHTTNIRPMLDIILYSTRKRDGILISRDEVHGDSSFS